MHNDLANDLADEFLKQSLATFRNHKRLADEAMAQVSDVDFFAAIDEEVNRIAHSSVGGSVACGMVALVTPLQELERMAQAGRLAGAELVLDRVRKELEHIRVFLKEYLKLEDHGRRRPSCIAFLNEM